MEGTGEIAHLLHQRFQLFFQCLDFTFVLLGYCQQGLVLLLPPLEIAPGLRHQLFLATVVLQELPLALGVERPLLLLRLPHGIEQLIEIGDLAVSGAVLGVAARRQQQAQQDARSNTHGATHESPPAAGMGKFNSCGAVIFCATRKAWARPRL